MADDNEVLARKTRETEAMRKRVAEMEEVKQLMEKQVEDYSVYEVSKVPLTKYLHNVPT